MTLSSTGNETWTWNGTGLGKSATGELQTFSEIPRATRNNYKLLSLVVFHNWEATSSCCNGISGCRKSLRTRGRAGSSFLWVQTKLFLTGKNLGWGGDGRKLTWAHLPSKNGLWCFSPCCMSLWTCYWIKKTVVLSVWCGGRTAWFSITPILLFPHCIF